MRFFATLRMTYKSREIILMQGNDREKNLGTSLAERILAYAQHKHLSAQTLARWQAWTAEDQAQLLMLAEELQLGENHLRDFIDWLEEIVLRDGGTLYGLLSRPEIRRLL